MLVHSRSLVCRDDAFGRWRTVAQSAVRPDCVVVVAPPFDQELSLTQRGEDLAVQKRIPETGVKALAISVFPR